MAARFFVSDCRSLDSNSGAARALCCNSLLYNHHDWVTFQHIGYGGIPLQRRRRDSAQLAIALLIAFQLVGCARPKDANITAFSNATTALTTFAKSTGDLNVQIDGKIKLATSAYKSIAGTNTDFPPPKSVLVTGESDADWKAVTAFLGAVSAYASALSAANNPNLESNLSSKIPGISTALSNIAAANAAANSQNSQRIQLIGNIAGAIVDIASNLYASIEIRDAMSKAQPILETARAPLEEAIYHVYSSTQLKLTKYETVLWCQETTLSGYPVTSSGNRGADPCRAFFPDLQSAKITQASTLERYNNYAAISQEDASLKLQLSALKDVSKAVGAMIDAHAKLMQDLDNQAALTTFLQDVDTIATNISKAQALNNSKPQAAGNK